MTGEQLADFRQWLLTHKGFEFNTIATYAKGAEYYSEFLGDTIEPIAEIPYEYDGIVVTPHAVERLSDRLNGISEETFINLLETQDHEAEYQDYEADRAQHRFKVTIPAFNLTFIGGIDQFGKLIVITIY